jgi:CBS domain-containing protein
MQTIREVMTPDVQTISAQETVQRAAQMMDELDVGATKSAGVVEGALDEISSPSEPDRSETRH